MALSCAGLACGTLLAGLLGFGVDAGSIFRPDRTGGLFWSSVRMAQWAAAATLAGLAVIAAIVLAFTAHLGHAKEEKEQSL